MTNAKPAYYIKDQILTHLVKNSHESHMDGEMGYDFVSNMARRLECNFDLIFTQCEDMIADGSLYREGDRRTGETDMLVSITPKGKLLINEQGGYAAKEKVLRRQQNWTRFKNIAVVSNAVLTLVIAGYSAHLGNKSNKLEDQNEALQKKLDSLTKAFKADSKSATKEQPLVADSTLKGKL